MHQQTADAISRLSLHRWSTTPEIIISNICNYICIDLLEKDMVDEYTHLLNSVPGFIDQLSLYRITDLNDFSDTVVIAYLNSCFKNHLHETLIISCLIKTAVIKNRFNVYTAIVNLYPQLRWTNLDLVKRNILFLPHLHITEIRNITAEVLEVTGQYTKLDYRNIRYNKYWVRVLAEACVLNDDEKINHLYQIFQQINPTPYSYESLIDFYPVEILDKMHSIRPFVYNFQNIMTIETRKRKNILMWFHNTFKFSKKELEKLLTSAVKRDDYYTVKWLLEIGVNPRCNDNAAAKSVRDRDNLRVFLLLFKHDPLVIEGLFTQPVTRIDHYILKHNLRDVMEKMLDW